ncbi:hypothetical protein DXX93_18745 [Thalassotalea euphylliae]|uniref:Relaxase n=1 Tax=Thalassotalea euphylliae TaxID=1655234 RepID=A0A3E0TVA5_9GAMM|nr:hypothetical protein [Thalassotalea euphylliae]REL28399.1 hypothetical protein DXX93_18745 [Thalassotalea euphylliae]
MIIKSMSRKTKSFSQLYHYMKSGSSLSSEYDVFRHNLYATQDKDIVREFLNNARFVKSRKNGNYLFHEVISITKSSKLTLAEEKQRLLDIIQVYVQKRCDRNLVAGYLHDEKDNNVHYHLMISSNEVDSPVNQRLTKFEFDKAKRETEKYVIATYPELEQDILISATSKQRKTHQSNKASEVKRRGGRLEKRENVYKTLNSIFAQSKSMQNFFARLAQNNIQMYNRGKAIGFITLEDGKKYRLKTLKLEAEFKEFETRISEPEHSQKEEDKKRGQAAEKNKQTQSSHTTSQTSSQRSVTELERRKAQAENIRKQSHNKDRDRGKEH